MTGHTCFDKFDDSAKALDTPLFYKRVRGETRSANKPITKFAFERFVPVMHPLVDCQSTCDRK